MQNPVPLLLQLSDQSPHVRVAACEQLGTRVYPPDHYGAISHGLLEVVANRAAEDHRVTESAIESVGNHPLSHARIVSTLTNVLSDEEVTFGIASSSSLMKAGITEQEAYEGLLRFISEDLPRPTLLLLLAAQEWWAGSPKLADTLIHGIALQNQTAMPLMSALAIFAPPPRRDHYAQLLERLAQTMPPELASFAQAAIQSMRARPSASRNGEKLMEVTPISTENSSELAQEDLDSVMRREQWRGIQTIIMESAADRFAPGTSLTMVIKYLLSIPPPIERGANVQEISALLEGNCAASLKIEILDALKECDRHAIPLLSVIHRLKEHCNGDIRRSAIRAFDVVSTSYLPEKL